MTGTQDQAGYIVTMLIIFIGLAVILYLSAAYPEEIKWLADHDETED